MRETEDEGSGALQPCLTPGGALEPELQGAGKEASPAQGPQGWILPLQFSYPLARGLLEGRGYKHPGTSS